MSATTTKAYTLPLNSTTDIYGYSVTGFTAATAGLVAITTDSGTTSLVVYAGQYVPLSVSIGSYGSVVTSAGASGTLQTTVPVQPASSAADTNSFMTYTESVKRVLRAAARGVTPIMTVSGSPPTYSVGAVNGNSTIIAGNSTAFGQGAYQPNDTTRIDQQGGILVVSGSNYVWQTTPYTNAALYRGSHGAALVFATDASAFDICINTGGNVMMYYTDMATGIRYRAQTADITPAAGAAYYKWDFGSVGNRIIEVSAFETAFFRGINVATTASIWKAPKTDAPRAGIVWDSFGVGTVNPTGPSPVKNAVTDFFGAAIGQPNPYSMSIGNTGFLNPGGGFGHYQYRVTAGAFDPARVGNLDVVFIPGSVNDDIGVDANYTDAALVAAMQIVFKKASVDQPSAIIVGCPPESTINRPMSQTRADAMKAAFYAVAATDAQAARFVWLDSSPAGENWLSGSASTGPNSVYIATAGAAGDGTHPNLSPGQAYVGNRMGQSLLAQLQLLAQRY